MKEPVITFEELMKELEKFRINRSRKRLLTKHQEKFIKKCRDYPIPVPYIQMAELWERAGWGKVGASTMRTYWKDLKK